MGDEAQNLGQDTHNVAPQEICKGDALELIAKHIATPVDVGRHPHHRERSQNMCYKTGLDHACLGAPMPGHRDEEGNSNPNHNSEASDVVRHSRQRDCGFRMTRRPPDEPELTVGERQAREVVRANDLLRLLAFALHEIGAIWFGIPAGKALDESFTSPSGTCSSPVLNGKGLHEKVVRCFLRSIRATNAHQVDEAHDQPDARLVPQSDGDYNFWDGLLAS